MNYEVVIAITVVTLGMLLGVWGASLVVRAMASRASRIALRLARRIPKRINTAPPQLSLLQFWFGVIVGPIACLAGTTLCVFVIGVVALEGEPFRWSAVPPIMLIIFAAGALAVGFRWDKARGRRRCPKCWYDYAGLSDAAACPECGRVPNSARALARTRRSRAIMLAAPVLLIAAWLTHITPIAMQTSWRAFVPTTVLIGFYEYMPRTVLSKNWRANDASLEGRLIHGDIAQWQREWLTRRSLRLLSNSSDPKTCAFALYFNHLNSTEWSFADEDATAAHLLRVGFAAAASNDPNVSMYSGSLLAQPAASNGPKARAAVADNLTTVLSRFQQPIGPGDHAVFGRLIARSAPADDRVVACVRTVALDPQWQQDRRDQAAAVLGTLASMSNELHNRLKNEYALSQGATRRMLALALVSARVQGTQPRQGHHDVASDPAIGRANSARLAEAMRDDDVDIRRASAKIVWAARLTLIEIDLEQTLSDLSALAITDRECAASAIHAMGWNAGITDEVMPVIAQILESGTNDDVAMIATVLRWQQMDKDWIAIRGPLNARVNDTTLDQPTLTALAAAKAELDAKVPSAPAAVDLESTTPQ